MKKIIILVLILILMQPVWAQQKSPFEILNNLESSINSIKSEVSNLGETVQTGLSALEESATKQSDTLISYGSSIEKIQADFIAINKKVKGLQLACAGLAAGLLITFGVAIAN